MKEVLGHYRNFCCSDNFLCVRVYVSHCSECAVEKRDRQKRPCGISSVISCSLLNKAVTVEGLFS